jgi:transketolase
MKQSNTRIAVTDAMIDLAAENPCIVLVVSDSKLTIKCQPYIDRFPDRFFDVGIAEQNAVVCAAGMAAAGLIPFFCTYAGFITMRACEQVRSFVAYPGLNVKMVGANGGIAGGEREGVTHQFFEDLGILRAIPGITVVVPADGGQVSQAVKAVACEEGPAYIRIGSGRDPLVFDKPMGFELGKARVLRRDGNDVALFGNGSILPRVFEAAEVLSEKGIKATVVEVHTLKPLDVETIVDVLSKTRAAVTVEDHNIIGGLGSAIAETSAEEMPVPLARIGLRDTYPRSGAPDELLDYYQMGVTDIVAAARRVIEKKS